MKKKEFEVQVDKKIKEYRKARNLSQRELASQVNIERSSLAHYEAGDRMPDIFTLWRIADCLGVSLDELVGRDEATQGSSIPKTTTQ